MKASLLFLVSLLVLLLSLHAFAAESGQVVWNVHDYGAKADGTTDDTQALQAAIDTCAAAGGGTVVLPAGTYFTAGTLSLPPQVKLSGAARVLDGWGEASRILVTNREQPFLTLNSRCAVEYLQFEYPEQPEAPPFVPYPWTLDCKGDNCQVIGVSLLNPYDAIRLVGAGRHLVRDVHGCPYHTGIYIDGIFDVGRIENVHFWPFKGPFKADSPKWKWISDHGEAFIIGRTDWQFMYNCFCFGYHIGYHFIRTKRGVCNGNFQGIAADFTQHAVVVDDCAHYGLLISNGEFVSVPGPDPVALVVEQTNHGTVNFSNCAVWGPSNSIARIAGTGFVTLAHCNFMEWDRKREGLPAVDISGGNVILTGNQFLRSLNPSPVQVRINPGAQAVTITGNASDTPWQILNSSSLTPQIGLNSARTSPEKEQ